MKASKSFNNISTKLQAEIPKLKPGETVLFKMLNGVPNPEPDPLERSKSPMLYGKVQLSTNYRIYDPYLKNENGDEVGGFVDVGCVEQWNGDKPDRFRCFIPGKGEFSQFQGKFQLTGGSVADEELYEILWLSPQRKGNKYGDESVEKMFEIVDLKANSKATTSKIDILRSALELANTISEKDARMVLTALNQPDHAEKDVMMASFGELARNNPDLVLATYANSDTPTLALIKSAIAKNVITHDFGTGDVKMGGVKIHTMHLEDLATLAPQLLLWFKTSQNGRDVLANIKAQLGILEKPNVPAAFQEIISKQENESAKTPVSEGVPVAKTTPKEQEPAIGAEFE